MKISELLAHELLKIKDSVQFAIVVMGNAATVENWLAILMALEEEQWSASDLLGFSVALGDTERTEDDLKAINEYRRKLEEKYGFIDGIMT